MTAIAFHRIIIVAFILSGIVGCNGDAQNKLSNVGETVGEGVTEFAMGIGKGVDNRLEVSIELSPALIQSGISTTVAKQTQLQAPSANPSPKEMTVYFLASTALDGTLVAKAYSTGAREIGRAKAQVSFDVDDAQYVSFSFPPEMDQQGVEKYVIDFVERKSETKATTPDSP